MRENKKMLKNYIKIIKNKKFNKKEKGWANQTAKKKQAEDK